MICSQCKEDKPESDFSPGQRMTSGKRSYCKHCSRSYALKYYYKNQQKIAEKRKEKRSKDYGREYHLKRTFGIDLEDYEKILNSQDRKCAICQKPSDQELVALAVDHCHETGFIRGLLCTLCNKNLIGKHTNSEIFLRAYNYMNNNLGLKVPERFRRR